MRHWMLNVVLLAGCTTRAAPGVDGAPVADSVRADVGIRADRSVARDAAAPCTTLTRVGQVSLDHGDTMKTTPALAFDGERFAVVWHSQPAPVSSLMGELRFARVDRSGKTSAAVSLGGDNGALEPALVASRRPTRWCIGPRARVPTRCCAAWTPRARPWAPPPSPVR